MPAGLDDFKVRADLNEEFWAAGTGDKALLRFGSPGLRAGPLGTKTKELLA